jgi:hypothetical protein
MDSRAPLGNTNDNRWEQLLGRGAYHCERCNQAWLLITADDSGSSSTKIGAHACKNCGGPLIRLSKGQPAQETPKEEGGDGLELRIA